MKHKFFKLSQSWLLAGILLIAIFLRFNHAPYRYSLGRESIRDAFVAIESAKELQLPLIGPFSSTGPYTFGPWYWYQLIIFFEKGFIQWQHKAPHKHFVFLFISTLIENTLEYNATDWSPISVKA